MNRKEYSFLFWDEMSQRRFERFKKRKFAYYSLWALVFLIFTSFTAEFWANSKPLVMKFKGHWYAPVLIDYHPSEFSQKQHVITDYRALQLSQGDWWIWPLIQWDPFERNPWVQEYPSPPTRENFFGTDENGRDVLVRLLYGLRCSWVYALGVWFLTYTIGVLMGIWMGFSGGVVDLVGMRVIEIIESLPHFILLLTLISLLQPTLWFLILFSMVFEWTNIAIYVRAEYLTLKKREFVEAAQALGASRFRLAFKHLLPNALNPVFSLSPFKIASNISALAVLDYLGFGLQPPTPSWGDLLNQAQKYFMTAEWLFWAPSLGLLLSLTLLMNVGLAAREVFDVHSGSSR